MNQPSQNNPALCFIWAFLFAVVGIVIPALTYASIVQAFRGPRPIGEDEVAQMKEPSSGSNYVTFRATGPVNDTGLRFGKKGNEGTKYLLTKAGDRHLLISARIDNNGPEFTGRLETISGTETEVVQRLSGQGRVLPVYLQAVRSIWFDAVLALVGTALFGGLTLWMLCRGVYLRKQRKQQAEEDPADYEPPPAFRKGGSGAPDVPANDRVQKAPRRSEDEY